ncbi:PEPxxWA-CTERM sorting domain-containing protein [Sphingomonas sp. Tas61C01]|uniref:PEPxxWA-CTERM sorting domain-containing protein n=1 Tax=Sphingomonas sp. Tas61C01 TaxID=3458297 RepID=UPI00403E5669
MLLLLGTPVSAATMNLTYSTQNGRNVVDAVLTVDPAMFIASDGRRAMRITGITGTRNKLAITGLAPASPGDFFDPNQFYFLEDAPFDNMGLGFTVAGTTRLYNLIGYQSTIYPSDVFTNEFTEITWSRDDGYGEYIGQRSARVTLSPLIGAVPEPGTWLLMLLGFGAIGLHLRRRAPDAPPSLA